MVSPVLRTDAAPNYPVSTLEALHDWARRPSAEGDLEKTFGPYLDWAAAYRFLHAFRTRDFSALPEVACLEPGDMPGLLGGYSRDLNRIFLAADCPDTDRTAVLLEEIGHFLDHALCSEETPGDEGAVFAALILGVSPAPWVSDDRLWPLQHEGGTVLVEAARKLRGSLKNAGKFRGKTRGLGRKGKGKNANTPVAAPGTIVSQSGNVVYAFEESVRVVQTKPGQRLIGSRGDDTFVVLSEDVDIQDPHRSTDTVEAPISFSLVDHFPVENLALAGSAHINGTGNAKANLITGNSGNNRLDGGNDSQVDTLAGGAGNDTYVLRDTLDVVVELPGGGTDTIETNSTAFSLAKYANVEALTVSGTLSGGVTFTGNDGNNILTGTSGNDSLNGGAGIDTLIGLAGNDSYRVDNDLDLVIEAAGKDRDTVFSTAPHYTLPGNVEILRLADSENISGTGNELDNTLYGNNSDNSLHGLDGNDLVVGDGQLPGIDLTGRKVSETGRSYLLESTNALVNGLGTPEFLTGAGSFGERTVSRNDDGSSSQIDLTSIFGSNGLNLYGRNIRSMFVNTNGNITFDAPLSTFTPSEISAGSFPIIAPFWADVDTRGGRATASTGGNSTGSNLIYYDVDADARVLTVTWDDVGYYPQRVDKVNAFQLQIIDSGDGNAFVIYRYENIDWTTGGASGGTDGLGGQAARAGFNSGTGILLEFPQSGDDQSMLNLDQTIPRQGLDSGRAGVFVFEIRNGQFVDNFGGNDWLFGGKGNDSLLGGGGNDTLLGEEGNDSLDGGLGADSMLGGAGDDTYVVDNPGDKIIERPDEGTDTVFASANFSLAAHFEILQLTGTGNVSGTGNSSNNTLIGNTGNNILRGREGNDFLYGGEAGSDTLYGESGNDTLQGGTNDNAADSLVGGDGDDTYIVEAVLDSIFDSFGLADRVVSSISYSLDSSLVSGVEILELAGSGDLNATGDSGANTLFGNSGNNFLDGRGGSDTLVAGDGDDTLNGGIADGARDSLVGGKGDDLYILDSDTDSLSDEEGIDTVFASFSVNLSSTLVSGIENITLNNDLAVADLNIHAIGNSLENTITGNSGNNNLDGRDGADILEGREGNDILNGGAGDNAIDTLNGGAGNDIYVVDVSNLDFPQNRVGVDLILDSGGDDTVQATSSYDLAKANISGPPIKTLFFTGNSPAILLGNATNNLIRSLSAGDDVLEGREGNDTLDGGLGANTLHGGNGDDYYIVNSELDEVFETPDPLAGIDTISTKTAIFALGLDSNVENLTYDPKGTAKTNLSGSNSDNTITGGNFGNAVQGFGGNDYLIGGVQADTLDGGADNDTLDGRGGVDVLIGGTGDDYYFADSQSMDIRENADEGHDTIRSTVNFSLTYGELSNVEGLYLVGGENLNGIGNALGNTITGNDGNNSLSGKAGGDTILGGLGVDLILGDEGNDSLVGGGNPQGDIPADASTPIFLASGQTYTGQINSRNETDWIKVDLLAGVTYTFNLDSQLSGGSILQGRSDVAFGAQGSDGYWGWQDGVLGYAQPPLIGDLTPNNSLVNGQAWVGNLTDHDELVLNSGGSVAYGFVDPASVKKSAKFSNNIVGFKFTPFDSGTFFIPISSAGPALGTYRVTLTDPKTPESGVPALADNASNTIIGGAGADTLVAGNGRDSLGNAIGDILLGGTNGLLGKVDTDTSSDTLVGGDGDDSLDGGNGANSLIGGKGNDYYYIRSADDKIVEAINGGTADAMIINFAAKLGGAWDIVLDPDKVITGPGFRALNVENVTLTGSTDTSVLGSQNSDKIVGNFGDNSFDGGAGDDSLYGEGGDDSLVGGDGADFLDGGSGTNTLDGGRGSDTYIVNDRNDRIINENLHGSIAGGQDVVRTYFNFDPIQGSALEQFQPDQPDNSPSVTKSPSFASRDLQSFYNLENFELLGQAAYGVGNALDNSMTASDGTSAMLLGMGGEDALLGGTANDSLFGDTPRFYALPDLYAPAPTDTRTQDFLNKIVGDYASDYLDGKDGNDYLDGGRWFDTMVGGLGSDTFIQDHVDDYVIAKLEVGNNGLDELITSVNIDQAPDGINDMMLVVKDQDRDKNGQSITGQEQVASKASFLGSKDGNKGSYIYGIGTVAVGVQNANSMELMYSYNDGDTYRSSPSDPSHLDLIVSEQLVDSNDNTKVAYELSWSAQPYDESGVVGYAVRYRQLTDEFGNPFFDQDGNPGIWKTYLDGTSQDLRGTQPSPALLVDNLARGTYEFEVVSNRLAMPVVRYFEESDLLPGANPSDFKIGQALREQVVTLQGGGGNDFISAQKLVNGLPGGLVDDALTDPLALNNPLNPLPFGFIFAPEPVNPNVSRQIAFAAYLEGGGGNDLLISAVANGGLGVDYEFRGITFSGLNTMVGGQGSDTFVVKNGGQALGDAFDHVIKYGNETPVTYSGTGIGASLNGGQHNLVVSAVPYLTLSDTVVSQGKFIDQLVLSSAAQFGMGNRLDNFIADGLNGGGGSHNTLVGGVGRDSIQGGAGRDDVLVGGTAYGVDNVGMAVQDFASKQIGGYELQNSIYRDTDPIPVSLNGPAKADPSQFWYVPGYYGEVFDPARNRDTLVAADASTLDGGAGNDSLVGSNTPNSRGDNFFVSRGPGGIDAKNIFVNDAVFGNGGNDTVTFTDSDYLWWSGHQEGAVLNLNGYTIAGDISNLVLQIGSPTARNGTGNRFSTGYDHAGWFDELGSNLIVGNEFDNIINGGGVGGDAKVGGVDTLTGGLGSDLFVVSGYMGASNTIWNIDIERNIADDRFWDLKDSDYSDADYVIIQDFSLEDYLDLEGGDWWIGRAPSYFGENNVRPAPYDTLKGISSTEFGIYRSGTYDLDAKNLTGQGQFPDLIAVIRTADGLALDLTSLVQVAPRGAALTPADGFVDAATAAAGHLGWGAFFSWSDAILTDGSDTFSPNDFLISQGDYKAFIQEQSTASLSQIFLSGSNTFQGTSANDSFNGFNGNDTLSGGSGNDTLLGEAGQDSLLGEAGNDSLLGGAGFDIINGGTGNDTLLGGSGNDNLDGGTDNDSLLGESGNDSLLGSAGNDTLLGGFGNDTLSGGDNNDSLLGEDGSDSLLGNAGNDTLLGGDGNDYLDGGVGINSLIGGAGDDTLVWGTGNASLDGGTGVNSLLFTAAANLNDLEFGVISNFSALIFSDQDDSVALGANARTKGFTSINGNGGNDTINALAMTVSVSLAGGAGNDSLLGGIQSDSLAGGADNDTILGDAGNDTILGEDGNDSVIGGGGNDSLIAGTGVDTLIGGAGNDSFLLDSTGVASMVGGDDSDSFYFATGAQLANNTLVGGNGSDVLILTAPATLIDSQFANVREVESISGSSLGGNLITLGINAQNGGILTLTGGVAGRDTLSAAGYDARGKITIDASASTTGNTLEAGLGVAASNGGNTLQGGQAGDLFRVSTKAVLQSASLIGGGGVDTLQVTSPSQVLVDLDFGALTSMEVLQLSSGANAITLGATAQVSANATLDKLSLIVGGTDSDTLTADSSFGNTAITLDGGAGDDHLVFSSAAQLNAASLIGGIGTDTLRFSSAVTGVLDSSFSSIAGGTIEALALTSGTNTLALGANAQSAGIRSLIGGTGSDSINASTYTADLIFDATANTDTTLNGGIGNDQFLLRNNNVLSVSSVVGGLGRDTIAFSEDGLSITDNSFSRFLDVEVFLARDGTNYFQLGAIAGSSGIASVISGTGSDTFDAASYQGTGLSINSGAEDDLIILDNAAAVRNNSVNGGADAQIGDILSLSSATTLVDADLANVTGIEILSAAATGKSSLTVGANAQRGGIRAVIGGNDNDTLNAAGHAVGSLTLDGGAGDDNLVLSTGARLFQSRVVGGAGSDTLSFAVDALSVTDGDFLDGTNNNTVSQVEFLKTANGNNRFILGTNAETAGISTIQGGNGNDTLSVAGFTRSVTLDGGTGNDFLTGGGANDRISGTSASSAGASQIDTLTGGAGSDTFVLGDAANAYYITAANGGDYAVITDFALGDKIQLRTLNPAAAGNGYLIGTAIYGGIGTSTHYLYSDTNNNGTVELGDNLVAAINSSVALTTADLKSTHGSFV